ERERALRRRTGRLVEGVGLDAARALELRADAELVHLHPHAHAVGREAAVPDDLGSVRLRARQLGRVVLLVLRGPLRRENLAAGLLEELAEPLRVRAAVVGGVVDEREGLESQSLPTASYG